MGVGDILKNKSVDVRERYCREIGEIEYILKNLEEGRYYEKTSARGDGYLATNITNLRNKLNDLINKVEYNLDSDEDKIVKAFSDI